MGKCCHCISFCNAPRQIKNPTVALIRKNRIHILGPDRRLIAYIKKEFFQFLLQAQQLIASAQQDHISSSGVNRLPPFSQPLVDKQCYTLPIDPSTTIALYDEL